MKRKAEVGKFLVVGGRGGFFHVRAVKDSQEEARTLAASIAGLIGSGIQMQYHVCEVKETFTSPQPYTRKKTR
jgi:hypothetical protein